MSRKCNTKHPSRNRSHYGERLAARGLTKAPALPSVENLRTKQTRESWLTEHPSIVANLAAFHGESSS